MRIVEGLVYSGPLSKRDDINTVWYLARRYQIKMGFFFHVRRMWVNMIGRIT